MPLDTYRDPPEIERRFNDKAHEYNKKKLQEDEIRLMEETRMSTRMQLRETAMMKRVENKTWESQGRASHRSNMRIFKEERQREKQLESEVRDHVATRLAQTAKNAEKVMTTGIDSFEQNLRRLGISTGAKSETTAPTHTHNDDDYINRIRTRKHEEVAGRKERTKRRQKMLLDQQSVYKSIYEKQKQERLLEKIMKQSKDERNLGQELQKQAQWKQVMVANRKFREAQYDERKRMDEAEHKNLTTHLREKECELYESRRSEELEKVQIVINAKEKEKKAKRNKFCTEVCNDIFYIAWQAIDYRERTDSLNTTFGKKALVPEHLWKEWLFQFHQGACGIEPADELPECETLIGEMPKEEDPSETEEPQSTKRQSIAPGKRLSVAKRQSVAAIKKEESPTKESKDPPTRDATEEAASSPSKPQVSDESLDILRLMNKEEIKNYCWRTNEWSTAATAPTKPFNEHICTILNDVNKVLYPTRAPFKRKDMNGFMLVLLTGKPLSGKSVVAKAVAEQFNFNSISIRNILTEALNGLCRGTAAVVGDTNDGILKDLLTERLELTRLAKDELDSGKEVSDASLVNLAVNYYKQVKRQSEITSEMGSVEEPETSSKVTKKGLILEGFPRTSTQLRMMEEKLTTYSQSIAEEKRPAFPLAPEEYISTISCSKKPSQSTTDDDHQNEQTEDAKEEVPPTSPKQSAEGDNSSRGASPVEGHQTPIEPVAPYTEEELKLLNESCDPDESAFDLVLCFEVSDSEVSIRYAGERVDPMTGNKYHLTYNPPDDATVNRLLECDRTTCDMELLHTKLTSFRHDKKRIVAWLYNNGHDIHKDIECEGLSLDQITKRALEEVQICIEKNEQAGKRHATRLAIREKRQQDELRYQKQVQERNEQQALKTADEAANYNNTDGQPRSSPATATPESSNQVGGQSRLTVPIILSDDVARTIIQQWEDMTRIFEAGLSDVFVELRRLKLQTADHFILNSKHFKEILSKPNIRQQKLSEFQQSFNSFDIELRREKDGMAELHLRVDTLQQDLWKLSDVRKQEVSEVLQSYQSAPWHSIFRQAVQLQFASLIELELTRFVFTRRIIIFYYGASFYSDIKVSADEVIPDLTTDKREVDAKDSKGVPKGGRKPTSATKQKGGNVPDDDKDKELVDEFQKVYQRAVEWIEDLLQTNSNDNDAAVTSSNEEEQNRIEAERRARIAWTRESDLLTQRLEVICVKCFSFLEEISNRATTVYDKLNGYLNNSYETEMRAISSLASYVREHIEEQSVLDVALNLQGSNLIVNSHTYYVIPAEERDLQPTEEGDGSDFITSKLTKQDFTNIVEKFRGRAPNGLISKDDVVRLFLQVAAHTDSPHWNSHNKSSFEEMFNKMDWLKKGTCDWRSLCMSLILWSPRSNGEPQWLGTPSRKDIVTLRDWLCEVSSEPTAEIVHLNEEQFIEVPFWFDSPLPNVVANQEVKSRQIKKIIFDIFKNEDGKLNVIQFLLYLCPDRQILRGYDYLVVYITLFC